MSPIRLGFSHEHQSAHKQSAEKAEHVEVKIGVQNAARELSLESAESADDVEKAVNAAISEGGVLALTDERGRRVIVPVDRLAYVEIGEPSSRRVGFGTI